MPIYWDDFVPVWPSLGVPENEILLWAHSMELFVISIKIGTQGASKLYNSLPAKADSY